MNVTIFWDIALCSRYVNWRFRGTTHLHLQHNAASQFLSRPIFHTEDGDEMLLRNVSSHADYTALYPRRW
jgi:hypothetical protein